MRALITGGSGDLGRLLCKKLAQRGDTVVNLDPAPSTLQDIIHHQSSLLDRVALTTAVRDVGTVIHIAAWHGIHESSRSASDFYDLNVTGTFNILQAAIEAGAKHFVFMSSTSVMDQYGVYGHSKLLAESLVEAYARRHGLSCVILRPRAFIPPWNRQTYKNFLEWTDWFMKGAVHINDLLEATLIAIDHRPTRPAPIYIIDGAYDYSALELENWDNSGAGSTFAARYASYVDLAYKHGLKTHIKPRVLDISPDQRLPQYTPRYSILSLLKELKLYGTDGPPEPAL